MIDLGGQLIPEDKFLDVIGTKVLRVFFPPCYSQSLAYRLDAISQGPNNSRISGPNPLPLTLVMDMHASKTLCRGLYKSGCINSYYMHDYIGKRK
jgi:hypothetical protein